MTINNGLLDPAEGKFTARTNVLVVEDDEGVNRLIQKTLQREGFAAEGALNGADAVSRITGNPDVILLLDYMLPDMTGKQLIENLAGKKLKVPFIIITGRGDEKIAVEMMKMGARDYLVKDNRLMDMLTLVIRRVVKDLALEKKLAAAEKTMEEWQTDLSVLFTVSTAINQTIDMDMLFDIILDTIMGLDILNVEQKAGIFLVEGDRMKLVSFRGHPEDFLDLHKSMRIGDCLCGLAAKTGEIIVSKNCNRDIRHTIRYPGMSPHGHIIIPLHARGRTTGVLYLYLKADIERNEDKLKLLTYMGNQIGIAIENARLYEETKMFALHDPLTGLANRRMMNIVFERTLNRARRLKEPFSLMMLDIDRFKKYNDTYGHSAGDELLIKIATLILKETRQIDLVVRYGGEEFLVLLPETDLTRACEAAERVRKTVEAHTGVTISIGIASYSKEIQSEKELIGKADKALYKAKQNGRNRVEANA